MLNIKISDFSQLLYVGDVSNNRFEDILHIIAQKALIDIC